MQKNKVAQQWRPAVSSPNLYARDWSDLAPGAVALDQAKQLVVSTFTLDFQPLPVVLAALIDASQ